MLFGPDTMAKGQQEVIHGGMSGRFCGFRAQLAGFCQLKCQRQCLPSAFETACGPLGTEDISWKKIMSFVRFSTGLHRQDHPAVVSRILHSRVFVAIFTGIESARLLYLACFEGKRSGNDSQQLYPLCLSIAAAWNQLAEVYIPKNCCSFHRRRQAAT
jgi:hypothetical protein